MRNDEGWIARIEIPSQTNGPSVRQRPYESARPFTAGYEGKEFRR